MESVLKCLCMPEAFAIYFTVAAFLVAYIAYRFLIFILNKLVRKGEIIQEARRPLLWLFLEIAAVASAHSFYLPKGITHALHLMIIGTLGWLLVSILNAFYHNFVQKIDKTALEDLSNRSTLTQAHFLYKFLIFVIIVVTLGTILMTFPYIKGVGVGILGSAGIAGIALGIAARPILLNLMAGLQIAINKTIKLGDTVFVEGVTSQVESIQLTHVIVRTSDLRRLVIPISYFIDKPFENWDTIDSDLLSFCFIYCDYTVSLVVIRKKVEELLKASPYWNKRAWSVHMTKCTESNVEIRIMGSALGSSASFELSAYLREKLIDFLQKEHPSMLPHTRVYQLSR